MQTSVLSTNFKAAVKLARVISDGKKPMPILTMAHLAASETALTITTTNLESAIIARIGARTDGTWSACIPLDSFDTKADKRPYRLDLTADQKTLTVTVIERHEKTDAQRTVRGSDADEFPCIKSLDTFPIAYLHDVKAFKRALRFQGEATDTDRLANVYFAVSGESVSLTSSDGVRLHRSSLATNGAPGVDKFAMGWGSLYKLVKMLDDRADTVAIRKSDDRNQVSFAWSVGENEFEFISQTAAKSDLDTASDKLPDFYLYTASLNADEFKQNVRLAKVFSDTFTLHLNGCADITSAGDEGDYLGLMEYTGHAPKQPIILGCALVLDAVDAMRKISDTGNVELSFCMPSHAVLLGVKADGATMSAAIMPHTVPDESWSAYARGGYGESFNKQMPARTADEEARRIAADDEAARAEYLEWVRDALGLETSVKASLHTWHDNAVKHYAASEYYDTVEVWNYILQTYPDAPVPGFQGMMHPARMARKAA